MNRLIIDAKKLTPEILALIKEKYPEGYDDVNDVITFRNAKGEIVEAIEVKDEENIYLVKIGSYLNVELDNFEPPMDEIKVKPKDVEAADSADDSDDEHDENEADEDRPNEDDDDSDE